jgi:hypothetical protein
MGEGCMTYTHIFCNCPPRVRIPSGVGRDPIKGMSLLIGREAHSFCKECGKLKGEPDSRYEYFLMKKEHIAILQEGNVQVGDKGFPLFDEKRPLGNSDFIDDIAKILGYTQGEDEEYAPEQLGVIKELIKDLPIALTIILRTKSFVPGYYRAKKYTYDSWEILT